MNVADLERPINKTAGIVVSKGFRYSPNKKAGSALFDTPPALKPAPSLTDNESFTDLTGTRFGRLVVFGMSAQFKKRWVCRCDCGKYTMRSSKAIKNPENRGDRCDLCRHHAFLIRARRWKETGRDIDVRDV